MSCLTTLLHLHLIAILPDTRHLRCKTTKAGFAAGDCSEQLETVSGHPRIGRAGLCHVCAFSGQHRKLNVLVVDDEQLVADSLVKILNMSGFNARSLYSGSDAVEQATQNPYDVLISEVVLKGLSGIDAAIEIGVILPNCNVLLVSGDNQTDDMLKSAHEHGHDFEILAKPFHPTVIIDRLKAMRGLN